MSSNVTVVARVRDCPHGTDSSSRAPVITVDGPTATLVDSRSAKTDNFTYDTTFCSHDPSAAHYASQEEVFDSVGKPFIEPIFDGYNCTLMAYGQSGSGKTYTMAGTSTDASDAGAGLEPRLVAALFHHAQGHGSIELSKLEVYNEKVYDLLCPQHTLKVRDSGEGIFVEGLTRVYCKDAAAAHAFMKQGDRLRTTASTAKHDVSSRSHGVTELRLTQRVFTESGEEQVRQSKLTLLDLAGSEKAARSGAVGIRLEEGKKINKSLLALGEVISALTTVGKKHIPYRDSILTRLLQDSLGGNAVATMVATVSP